MTFNKKYENEPESFGLSWIGKKHAKILAHTPPQSILQPENIKAHKNKEENSSHLMIKGDNLEVLKHLLKDYAGKIKMIYIDPPYNTGTENFLYEDKKHLTAQALAGFKRIEIEEAQDLLKDFNKNETSHSAWLSFMYPRLYVARQLLKREGVIFISIDDRELAYLRLLMDEIFGEDNFVGLFKWNKTSTPPSLSNKIRQKYEYILCYEKEKNAQIFYGGTENGGDMPLLNEGNSIKILKFPPHSVHFKIKGKFPEGIYHNIRLLDSLEIKNEGLYPHAFKMEGAFKWSQEYLNKQIAKGTELIVKSEKFSIRYKKKGQRIKKPDDIISKTQCGVGTNADAKKELFQIFGLKNMFDYPKPVSLLKYLINFKVKPDKEEIILDFFAGSGTTGDAVLQLNKEDGGNRKFILIQSDEKIDPQKNQAAYRFFKEKNIKNPGIFDITRERILRVKNRLKMNNNTDNQIRFYSLKENPE